MDRWRHHWEAPTLLWCQWTLMIWFQKHREFHTTRVWSPRRLDHQIASSKMQEKEGDQDYSVIMVKRLMSCDSHPDMEIIEVDKVMRWKMNSNSNISNRLCQTIMAMISISNLKMSMSEEAAQESKDSFLAFHRSYMRPKLKKKGHQLLRVRCNLYIKPII